jgi:Domain of unknown function (DUF6471)
MMIAVVGYRVHHADQQGLGGSRQRAIRAELARRNMSYRELSERLAAVGARETERNLSNKINRGTFTAVFLFQVMEAIGVRALPLDAGS